MSRLKSTSAPHLAALLAALLVPGCDDNCTRLAEAVCARTGESDPQCQTLRTRADTTTPEDRRACGKALLATELLTPKG